MRLSRHAKNRVRFIKRRAPKVSESALLGALRSARDVGRDTKGNHRLAVRIGGILLTAVIDEDRDLVITVWREE